MVIQKKPTTKFYKDLYKELKKFNNDINKGKKLKLLIQNYPGTPEYLEKFDSQIGYFFWEPLTKGKYEYKIIFAELESLDLKDKALNEFIPYRYTEYLESLHIKYCPETVALLTMLHELGHVNHVEIFRTNVSDNYEAYFAFTNCTSGIYESATRPWNNESGLSRNINYLTFNMAETYAELFALHNFPKFIDFLKDRGYNI